MTYVVVCPLDQTIGFLADGDVWTTHHKDARVFLSRTEADAAAAKHGGGSLAWVEEVHDLGEFRERTDTW